jgi:hypothetical protein
MATKHLYKGTDVAKLAAKTMGESLPGVSYMDPQASDHTYGDAIDNGTYSWIIRTGSVLGGLWGAKDPTFKDAFPTGSGNSVKLANAAAWGCAPIPRRAGLGNENSPYIVKDSRSLSTNTTYSLSWDKTNGGIYFGTKLMTKASCIVIDAVAAGGSGTKGYRGTDSGAYVLMGSGGGGGSGAAASLLVDMSKVETLTITTNASGALTFKKGSTTLLTLGNGGGGGDAKSWYNSHVGSHVVTGGGGGSGGTANPSSYSKTLTTGVYLLWAANGKNGGAGVNPAQLTGPGGKASDSTIKFIENNTITTYSGGTGGSGSSTSGAYRCGGGGGGASIFAAGGRGGDTSTGALSGSSGSGGGGDYCLQSDTRNSYTPRSSGNGGLAALQIYYEAETAESYTPGSSGGGSGGGPSLGCVFPGTQIFLDKNTSIDIAAFENGTPIDFCNPSTLEHFPQQTLLRVFSERATKKITLELEDGKSIELTPDHAILTEEGLKVYQEDDMFPSYHLEEKVATVDGYSRIIAIHEEPIKPSLVYNIITENSLMVANGIIVGGEIKYAAEAAALGGIGGSKDIM